MKCSFNPHLTKLLPALHKCQPFQEIDVVSHFSLQIDATLVPSNIQTQLLEWMSSRARTMGRHSFVKGCRPFQCSLSISMVGHLQAIASLKWYGVSPQTCMTCKVSVFGERCANEAAGFELQQSDTVWHGTYGAAWHSAGRLIELCGVGTGPGAPLPEILFLAQRAIVLQPPAHVADTVGVLIRIIDTGHPRTGLPFRNEIFLLCFSLGVAKCYRAMSSGPEFG